MQPVRKVQLVRKGKQVLQAQQELLVRKARRAPRGTPVRRELPAPSARKVRKARKAPKGTQATRELPVL